MAAHPLYDVAIVGGGASGLAASLSAARAGRSVLIIERDVALGLPILATGNGRCNISNAHLDPARYRHPDIARAVMGRAPERELAALFDAVGIMTCKIDGRLYPYSKRADSVREALLGAIARRGVEVLACADLQDATYGMDEAVWRLELSVPAAPLPAPKRHVGDLRARIRSDRKELRRAARTPRSVRARHIIIACGGASEPLAGLFGLPHIGEKPVLCPVACTPAHDTCALERLDGLRVDCRLGLVRDGEELWAESGEALFRSYGISGIVAFDLSRRCMTGDIVEVDLFCDRAERELAALFEQRAALLGDPASRGASWFDGMLAHELGAFLMRCAGREGARDGAALARIAKHLPFIIEGTTEHASAQVRRGGIPFDAVELPGLQVRPDIAPALSVCGEALDMDADCGGFNLAWAWLSGIRSAEALAR